MVGSDSSSFRLCASWNIALEFPHARMQHCPSAIMYGMLIFLRARVSTKREKRKGKFFLCWYDNEIVRWGFNVGLFSISMGFVELEEMNVYTCDGTCFSAFFFCQKRELIMRSKNENL